MSNGYLGGIQGEGARAVVCDECGALLPPHDAAMRERHGQWHEEISEGRSMSEEDGRHVRRDWWVCQGGFLAEGGKKVQGPFPNREEAIIVAEGMVNRLGYTDLCIDEEGGR